MIAKVLPESCQRTEGIFAWLEMKEEREKKHFEKERKRREKEEELQKYTVERESRNEERLRKYELKKRDNQMKENPRNLMGKETKKGSNERINLKEAAKPAMKNCATCKRNKPVCQCQEKNEVRYLNFFKAEKLVTLTKRILFVSLFIE